MCYAKPALLIARSSLVDKIMLRSLNIKLQCLTGLSICLFALYSEWTKGEDVALLCVLFCVFVDVANKLKM